MSETKVVNFNCPVKLLQEFDEAIRGRYGDRTDALLSLMRGLVESRRRL